VTGGGAPPRGGARRRSAAGSCRPGRGPGRQRRHYNPTCRSAARRARRGGGTCRLEVAGLACRRPAGGEVVSVAGRGAPPVPGLPALPGPWSRRCCAPHAGPLYHLPERGDPAHRPGRGTPSRKALAFEGHCPFVAVAAEACEVDRVLSLRSFRSVMPDSGHRDDRPEPSDRWPCCSSEGRALRATARRCGAPAGPAGVGSRDVGGGGVRRCRCAMSPFGSQSEQEDVVRQAGGAVCSVTPRRCAASSTPSLPHGGKASRLKGLCRTDGISVQHGLATGRASIVSGRNYCRDERLLPVHRGVGRTACCVR